MSGPAALLSRGELTRTKGRFGAVVGALPIVGVTLPLVSYGGSSLLPMLLGLGIAAQCTRTADK